MPLVRLEGGEVLAAFETRPQLPPGVQRAPVFLVFADAAGVIVDTLAQWAGRERHVTRDGWNPVMFGATALFAGRGVHALMGTNDSLALTLYRGVEPLTRIRGAYSPRAITAPERDALTERSLGRFPEEVQRDWRRRLEASTEREAYPAYEALALDPEGRIWIGFEAFWDLPPRLAEVYLDKWCSWAAGSGLQPVIDAAKTIRKHWDGILLWFRSRITNGMIEGINSLVQAAKARARGYRTTENFITIAYLVCGKLNFNLPT